MKVLAFEHKNLNQDKFKVVADWCLSDPDEISSRSLKKYRSRILNSYHWDNNKKLVSDRKKIDYYVKKIFRELIKKLNTHHNINNPDYYWATIILPWLYELITNLFDKWEIARLIKNKKSIEILLKKFDEDYFCFRKSDEFNNHNKDLNNYIFSKVINFKYRNKFKKIKYFNQKKRNNLINLNKNFFKYQFFNIFSKISNNKIIFDGLNFDNTVIKTIILNIKNFQFPIFYYEKKYHSENYNKAIRKKLFLNDKKKDFLQFCREEVSLLIPKSFLEDFKNINNSIKTSYLPKFSQKIFTCLKYRKNDFFQIWCAEQRLKGSKYFIFQHGGGYGHNFALDESYLNEICDHFLTWGWSSKRKAYKKFYSIKLSSNFKHTPKNSLNILLILHSCHKYSHMPVSKSKNSFDRVKKLYDFIHLSEGIQGYNLTVRYLSQLNKNYGIDEYDKYFKKKISVDHGEVKFKKILNNYNLVIHDSLETVFLETIAYNVPTIVLVRDYKNQIINSFDNDFNKLKDIGVIHQNFNSIKKMVNSKKFNINDWWFDKKNQIILDKFRKKFVRNSNNLYEDIGKLINQN